MGELSNWKWGDHRQIQVVVGATLQEMGGLFQDGESGGEQFGAGGGRWYIVWDVLRSRCNTLGGAPQVAAGRLACDKATHS